jgi:transposase
MKYYIGLDVSLATTAICAIDESGAIIKEGLAASDPDEIADWLEQLGIVFERVGLETGSTAARLYNGLRDRGCPAVCIDPRRLRAVTKTMPIKNDRNDARAIAHCMRVGWYSVVHVKSEVSQVVRMVLTNRRTLLSKQIDIENEIRGTLRVFGMKLTGRVTAGPFETRVLELVAETPHLEAIVRPMLVARAALRQQCAVLHKMILEKVRKSATCRRLMTIPSVGATTP